MTTDQFIKNAILEDVGDGDHTSEACVDANSVGRARMIIKENGVLAGTTIAEQIFYYIDPSLHVEQIIPEGSTVKNGDIALTVKGSTRSILKGERLALNCTQRMSGIASFTRQVVDQLHGLQTKVLDTRKTTPGLRFLEKLAVQLGGGQNHRHGLYDMMMIKDNHIDYAGSIEAAIDRCNAYRQDHSPAMKLEIEARNLSELDRILAKGGIDRIMLDNFTYIDLCEAVRRVNGKFETEASGNITISTARAFAECGVDFISMGALTHSARSMDISLKAY